MSAKLVYWYFETFIFNYGKPLDPDLIEKTVHAQITLLSDLLLTTSGISRRKFAKFKYGEA